MKSRQFERSQMNDSQTAAKPSVARRSRREKERRKKKARNLRRKPRLRGVTEQPPGIARWSNSMIRAVILRVGKHSRRRFNQILADSSLVGDPPWFERDQFPWMKTLEDNWETIRREARVVLEARDLLPAIHEISPDHDRLSDDGTWKTFFFYGYGNRFDRSCSRCPETAKLLESVPNLSSAFLSILAPGSHLPRHRGPTKAIITWHLGLVIPKDRENCWIEVCRQRRLWAEGESLIFDDAQKHEVRNDTDEERVVLLIHFDRPMRSPGSWLAAIVMRAIRWSPFVRDGKLNNLAWEKAFDAALAKGPLERAPVSSASDPQS